MMTKIIFHYFPLEMQDDILKKKSYFQKESCNITTYIKRYMFIVFLLFSKPSKEVCFKCKFSLMMQFHHGAELVL